MRSYSEMLQLATFEERFAYLSLGTNVGTSRNIKQLLYRLPEWRRIRRQIILRDDCCDLAIPDRTIFSSPFVHHLNPITDTDVIERRPCVFDPENLITVSKRTHEAIHHADDGSVAPSTPVERKPNDMCPWKRA